MSNETVYNTHIQIKRPDGESIYPVVDLGYERNVGDLPGDCIADSSIQASKLAETLPAEKGGTGASTISGARTNLDVYSKSEVADLISGVTRLSCVIVDALPEASIDTLNKIYLISHEHDAKDTYDEYLTIKSDDSYSWEKIGNTDVDLTDYSKKSHKHEFSGTSTPISVSGSYHKTTGVTIDAYAPEGTVALSRSSDVTLKTESIDSISDGGALPSLSSADAGDIPYLKGVSLNNALDVSYSDPTFDSKTIGNITAAGAVSDLTINETAESGNPFVSGLTKESYTPEGTVSSSFMGEESKINVSFTPAGSVDLGSSETAGAGGVKYVESVSAADVSGTSTDGFVTGINGGSGTLTSSTTESAGDIQYLSEVVIEDACEDGVLMLNVVTSKSYLHHEHAAASVSSTTSALTGVSGGSVTSTVKYMHPTFSGNEGSSEIAYTPSGKIDSAFVGVPKQLITDGAVKYIHFSKGTAPTVESIDVLVGKASSGSATITGSITLDKSIEYLSFSAGSLPTVQKKTVATGISQQPEFTGTFSGASATIGGKLYGETVNITSTGNMTPSGTITSAIE